MRGFRRFDLRARKGAEFSPHVTISYDMAPVGLIVERGAFSETMRPLIKYKIPIRLCGTFAFFFYYRSNEVVAKDNPLGEISNSEENPYFKPTALDNVFL